MFTLEDFIIGRAMTFNDDDVGLETCTSLRISESSDSRIRAEFLCHSGLPYDNASVSIYRKAGFATGLIEDEPGRGWEDDVIVHPSWLDAAIQTGLAAYSFPQDMRLWTLHVPTSVKTIKINPHFTKLGHGKTRQLSYKAGIDDSSNRMVADVDIAVEHSKAFVQFDSIGLQRFV
ncbi:hypothetical protein J3459_010376 [Metarhizium acridum]|nr:hypothetical protein J3459_010376 [Metarhizium acridum]